MIRHPGLLMSQRGKVAYVNQFLWFISAGFPCLSGPESHLCSARSLIIGQIPDAFLHKQLEHFLAAIKRPFITMLRLFLIALVCCGLRYALTAPAPLRDVLTAPMVQAIDPSAKIDSTSSIAHREFRLWEIFDLKHFPVQKIHAGAPGGKNVNLQVPRDQIPRKAIESNLMKPPQAGMEMDLPRRPKQEKEIKIGNISNNDRVGRANDASDPLLTPIFDFECACEETGCLHWSFPFKRMPVESPRESSDRLSEASNSKKGYNNSNASRKTHLD
ncbi:hypothetical protein Pst134EA_025924 [Puccinia striiformis f. sp. tritici]|nr:hypothetical protein Pst134EA_025924 [Puccinia striiformis f. sp. tritici]KAH9451987.1 hypothetical protein Pst134EA_025924 [Puccinia striiformis f. sp. tritici]KAI9629195.1 hypothetical protein KEM48_011041 [Puccinia striiformis f. sp. tritici PST-130]